MYSFVELWSALGSLQSIQIASWSAKALPAYPVVVALVETKPCVHLPVLVSLRRKYRRLARADL